MLFIPIIYFIVFHYLPLGGIVVAFKQYNIFQGIWDSPWVGLAHFKEVFASGEFRTALKNTIVLNLGELFITFPFPIVLAVLLNEMSNQRMKKLTQTVLYLPHFLSMVVIAGIVYQVFGTSGIVNNVLSLRCGLYGRGRTVETNLACDASADQADGCHHDHYERGKNTVYQL